MALVSISMILWELQMSACFFQEIKCLKEQVQNQKISYGTEMEIDEIGVFSVNIMVGHFCDNLDPYFT